ncbi:coat protein [Gentian ovary ringspot virus]|uniref:Coat protein n=1 Tax=Gentian ovary ringspot virus TaxID=1920772 RepID=A0A077JF34_9VIRU|nr:coat protein [Gentian ovary ringspot virus]BAP18644.1 coat protein [Gentian ovary ringspot virus]
MSNATMSVTGGGCYDSEAFQTNIKKPKVNQDWWIFKDNWCKLIDDLMRVNFQVTSARQDVSRLISAVHKDFPASVGRRFPGPVGTLGSANYQEREFFRLDSVAQNKLLDLVRIADQGKERDLEVNRTAGNGSDNQARPAPKMLAIRDQQVIRDGSNSYGYVLSDLVTTRLDSYDRDSFESEFNLVWHVDVPNNAG